MESHDDRAAIQSAIDATIAAGGGVVFFPAGDYVVGRIPTPETSLVSFYIHGVTTDTPSGLRGRGGSEHHSHASTVLLEQEKNGPYFMWLRRRTSRFVIYASTAIGSNIISPPGKKKIHCILLKRVVDVTVQNVEFREAVGHGIKLEGKLREEPGAESKGLRIVENLFVDSGRGGINLDGTIEPIEDVVIQGNIVRHTSESFAVLVSLDNTHRVQFVANTILGGAVQCSGIQDFVISNNIIVGGSDKNGDGLLLEGQPCVALSSVQHHSCRADVQAYRYSLIPQWTARKASTLAEHDPGRSNGDQHEWPGYQRQRQRD